LSVARSIKMHARACNSRSALFNGVCHPAPVRLKNWTMSAPGK